MSWKYFIWDIFGDDKFSKNAWIVTELDLIEPADPAVLTQGRKIKNWHRENRALYPKDTEGYRTDNVYADRVFLHSQRLKRLIQSRSRDEVAYYPILIERKDEKKRVKGYSALVPLDPVDAIDWENTPFEEMDGTKVPADEEDLTLDVSKIGSRRIFPLVDNNIIIVREDLVEEMRRARISGLGFTEVKRTGVAEVETLPEEVPAQPDPFHGGTSSEAKKSGFDDAQFESRVEDIKSCLGETKPKTYARKMADAKRMPPEALGRVLIAAIQRGDWSRVPLPMLVGGQVVDLFNLARIPEDLWDDALEALEDASRRCKMVPGPGYLRIYQELARGLEEQAAKDAGEDTFKQRVQAFHDSQGWNWTRHWFGPQPGFEKYGYMEDFDAKLQQWMNGAVEVKSVAPDSEETPDTGQDSGEDESYGSGSDSGTAKAIATETATQTEVRTKAGTESEAQEADRGILMDTPENPETYPAVPAVALTLRKRKEEEQRESKFGGMPYLPVGDEWPTCGHCGRPLVFRFQLHRNDVPTHIDFPSKMNLLTIYGCANEDCPVRSEGAHDASLWRYYRVRQTDELQTEPPEGVELLANCSITFRDPADDHYDPGHSATMNTRERKKELGDFGEHYRSVKVGGYPTFWHAPVQPKNEKGTPLKFLFQVTPEGTRSNLSSSFVNQSDLFKDRLELWWYDPEWLHGPDSLFRLVQKP